MRRLRPLAAAVVIALVGAGCGAGASSETGTATSAGTPSTARGKAVRFAACMRDNGVSGFPDPDASGELTIDGVLNGSTLNLDAPAWKAAIGACKDLEPSGFTGHKRNSGQQSAALQFARCMRENGVEDFPDPARGEPLVDTNRIPSAATSAGMSVLNAAMQKCGDHVAGMVRNR